MKNTIITLLLLSFFTASFAQELWFDVHGAYARPILKQTTVEAHTLSDLTTSYPSSWITDYISTEVSVTFNGNSAKAMGLNDTLTADQRGILLLAETGAEITLDVRYNYENSATHEIQFNQMRFTVTVIPDVEAEYKGGNEALLAYLKGATTSKITEIKSPEFKLGKVRFTVNEKGNITNAQMSKPSEDKKIDAILLDAIYKLPKWKPAEDSKGKKIQQDFEFTVSYGMGGC